MIIFILGIHMCGNIKVSRSCDFQGNTDKFCKFLKSNSHIIDEAGLMCGNFFYFYLSIEV